VHDGQLDGSPNCEIQVVILSVLNLNNVAVLSVPTMHLLATALALSSFFEHILLLTQYSFSTSTKSEKSRGLLLLQYDFVSHASK